MSVGVIVGRFQVDIPHAGHVELIRTILAAHGKTCILLGCSPLRLTKPDPLDYPTRERMFRALFPSATIAPLPDLPTDELWSVALDDAVRTLFPTDTDITLYGSRASFLKQYKGRFKTKEIPEVQAPSGTEIRDALGQDIRDTPDWRAGIIYCTQNKFPISYQCIDAAVIRPIHDLPRCPESSCKPAPGTRVEYEILLGQRAVEANPHRWRFPGGFVDPKDSALEVTVAREVREECGDISVGHPLYLGSIRVNDWRFRSAEDKLMTAFFACHFQFGIPSGGDDLSIVRWVPESEIPDILIDNHKELGKMLLHYLNGLRNIP